MKTKKYRKIEIIEELDSFDRLLLAIILGYDFLYMCYALCEYLKNSRAFVGLGLFLLVVFVFSFLFSVIREMQLTREKNCKIAIHYIVS